jgi:hypothetical protein
MRNFDPVPAAVIAAAKHLYQALTRDQLVDRFGRIRR